MDLADWWFRSSVSRLSTCSSRASSWCREELVARKLPSSKHMKKNLITAVLMTIATTVLLGILYPLVVTGLAQLIFPKQANGELIQRDGLVVGSRLIGQPFS